MALPGGIDEFGTAIVPTADYLALSDTCGLLTWASLDRERAAYERGRADGYAAGEAAGHARCDAEWMDALRPAREAARQAARTPDHADMERRRWGPGGREHFGDPRPQDYPGRGRGRDAA